MTKSQESPETALVDRQQYFQFLNAVVSSSDADRAEEAFKRARDSEPSMVVSAVKQIVSIGDLSSLQDYLKSRPARVLVLTELTRRLFPEDELEEVVDEMMSINSEDEDDGDFYYDQGDDSYGC